MNANGKVALWRTVRTFRLEWRGGDTSDVWNVYFGPPKLGRLDERHMRIEDEYGRLKRKNV